MKIANKADEISKVTQVQATEIINNFGMLVLFFETASNKPKLNIMIDVKKMIGRKCSLSRIQIFILFSPFIVNF